MPGYIDNSSDLALFESYSQGRALAGDALPNISRFAQWSAVLDKRTCDWCGWADERVFDTTVEPYDPPTHHGCRCLIAFISKDEFPPTADWGSGPPKSSWPPGRINGADTRGKPTLRSENKLVKPKPDLSAAKLDQAAKEFLKVKGNPALIEEWRRKWLQELMGAEYSETAARMSKDFWRSWAARSPRAKRELADALLRGTADDIAKVLAEFNFKGFMNAIDDDMLKWLRTNPEVLIKHFQTNLTLNRRAIAELYPDGKITVWRGVHSKGRGDDFVFKMHRTLTGGDTEFAIGSEFISSWSLDRKVAVKFAETSLHKNSVGVVFKKEIDVRDYIGGFLDTDPLARMAEKEMLWANYDGTLIPKTVRKIRSKFQDIDLLEVSTW